MKFEHLLRKQHKRETTKAEPAPITVEKKPQAEDAQEEEDSDEFYTDDEEYSSEEEQLSSEQQRFMKFIKMKQE